MKRKTAKTLVILFFAGLAVPLIGCGSEPSGAEAAENQIATVERGDMTIEITAVGNPGTIHYRGLDL